MFEAKDFVTFHEHDVPAALAAGSGRLAGADVAGLAPIAFRMPDGRAYSFVPGGGEVRVVAGDGGAGCVVDLEPQAWSDFVQEAHTAFGLLYAGLVRFGRGAFDDLARWEPGLRAVFHGRPLYDPAAVEGLDLRRRFSASDADADLRAHLARAGFVHLRGVFGPAEVAALSEEVERLRAAARPHDQRSWWARNAAGDDVCCRLIYTDLASAPIAALGSDPRLRRLGALAGLPLVPRGDRLDGTSVVIKNPAVVEGLSDLPWHRDCGLGGHPVLCPELNIGIQLDRADAANGQLHFLAGSHDCSSHPLGPGDEGRLPVVAVETEPGDVTVHFGHVFHAAPPPTAPDAGRRAMYLGFVQPHVHEVIPPGQGYNDVLFTGGRGGHVPSVDEALAGT